MARPFEWLSRQETARLLSRRRGDALPPSDELVWSQASPIRAKKARYFEDTRLPERGCTAALVRQRTMPRHR